MNKYKVLLLLCAAFSLLLISIVAVPALAQRVVTKPETKGEKDKLSAPVRADVAAPIRSHIAPAQISRSQAQISRSQIRPRRINVPNAGSGPTGPNYVIELEPNNSSATAQVLIGDIAKAKGTIQPATDVDYYSFFGFAGDRVYAATQTALSSGGSGLTGDSTIELYNTDGTTILEADNNDGTFDATASSIAGTTLPATGVYFIKVRHSSGAPASEICPYDLYLRLHFGSLTAETEPNNNGGPPNTPTPVTLNGWMSGVIDPAADNDVYSISLNAGDTVYLSLDPDPERDGTTWNPRLAFGIFDNFFLLINDANTTSPNSEAFFFTVREAGTYLIYVDESAGGGGPALTYNLSVGVHLGETFRTCTAYTSTNVPQAIPVAAGLATSTLSIPDHRRIGNLQVSLNITHSALGELDVSLIAPDGNEVVLFDDPAAAIGGTTAPQINFTLDDEAGVPVTAINGVNKSMIFQPESLGRLTWFKNQSSLGTWRLNVRDDAGVGSGTLNGWSVTVCEDPSQDNCQVPLNIIYSSNFEANDGGFTHSGTGDEWERGLPSFAPIITCASGTNCWKTDLDNTYNNAPAAGRIDQELVSPNIDLSTRSGQQITFVWAMKYQIEGSNWDNAYVEVREVGGSGLIKRVWEWAGPTMTGSVGNPAVLINSAAGWGSWLVDISEFGGKTVRLVFHLDQDDSVNLAGLAIDDVFVAACTVSGPLPSSAVSRKTHAPNAGVFDIAMPITGTPGIECRTGGATNDHTMVVTFPNAVFVDSADVTNGTGDVGSGGVANGGLISGDGTSVITIPLTNVANAQTIIVTLFDVDDFTNPRGNVSIPMSVLLGDVNSSASVNGTDVSTVKLSSGTTQASRLDVSVNGLVNGTDVSTVKLRSGTGLP